MKSAPPDLTRPDGTPLRVLVVDDEENIAELLRMALRYEGGRSRSRSPGHGPSPPRRGNDPTPSCST